MKREYSGVTEYGNEKTLTPEEEAAMDRLRRRITAVVVAATLLIVTLLGVIVYQIVTITVKNNRIKKLEADIARYEKIIADGELDLEYYESQEGLENAARKYGAKKQGSTND